jgi:hypothetical protein
VACRRMGVSDFCILTPEFRSPFTVRVLGSWFGGSCQLTLTPTTETSHEPPKRPHADAPTPDPKPETRNCLREMGAI